MDFWTFFPLVFGGFIGALIVFFVGNWGILLRINQLENRIVSIQNGYYGIKGNEIKQKTNARKEEAIMKVAAMVQAGDNPQDALKKVAVEYPDVAMQFLKEGGFKL